MFVLLILIIRIDEIILITYWQSHPTSLPSLALFYSSTVHLSCNFIRFIVVLLLVAFISLSLTLWMSNANRHRWICHIEVIKCTLNACCVKQFCKMYVRMRALAPFAFVCDLCCCYINQMASFSHSEAEPVTSYARWKHQHFLIKIALRM